ncbi:MAG: TraM recognition domain-containing protein [Geodermatophilaceae bacterium]|nr:TraM recognition domain-containing protein [Geodermatophilaceae bacterium]
MVRAPTATAVWWTASLAVFAAWWWLVLRRGLRALRRPARARNLAKPGQVAGLLSARAARKTGSFTRPDLVTTASRSRPRDLNEYGYRLGTMTDSDLELVANFELRVRVIARTGWGKTSRLLVPIVRGLPGAALVGSTRPDLFEQTVCTRDDYSPTAPRRRVMVVDFSEAAHRIAAGYERVVWDPIAGCEDLTVADRRAAALAAGVHDGDREDANDAFWRHSSSQVISAWLHAAALAGLPMASVLSWQDHIHSTEPHDILSTHPAAEGRAYTALAKHLDERAARTTSGVERFIALTLAPLGTADGQEFVGDRNRSLDIAEAIADQATIYLLASDRTARAVAPILTLFAEEWFATCRSLALRLPGSRLGPPAVAVLDELRWLAPIPSLPSVASEFRSYGVGLVYALQNARQETELYGAAAETLAQDVQVTIVGGHDTSLARDITDQAGRGYVARVTLSSSSLSRGTQLSEGEELTETITAADLQQLRDGESVIRVTGLPLFLAYSASFRDSRRLARQVGAEEAAVRGRVAAGRQQVAIDREQRRREAQAEYNTIVANRRKASLGESGEGRQR